MHPVGSSMLRNQETATEAPLPDESTQRPSAANAVAPLRVPHILYVIDQLCGMGGAEHMLFEIVRRLAPSRFRCSIVTFQVDPKFEALQTIACPLTVLPLRRTYDLNAAKVALRLRKVIREENISLVHTFFETSDIWAAPVARLSGCRTLVSSRRDMGILRVKKHQLAYPFVNPLFKKVLAVSEEVRSYCLNHDHIRPQRVETLYNGVDLEEMSARALEYDARLKLKFPVGAPIISAVANIRHVKGLDVMARAAAIVCREFPDATFVIVGKVLEPETQTALETLIDSLQLRNNVRFTGQLPNPVPVLRASDVFCLPSRNEGFSNALIEAMGCGLPCVATRVGGNPEALDDGRNGFLIDSEDVISLADRILQLLRDPSRRAQMGSAARTDAEARFSMNAMMNRLMNIYDGLLAPKAS